MPIYHNVTLSRGKITEYCAFSAENYKRYLEKNIISLSNIIKQFEH